MQNMCTQHYNDKPITYVSWTADFNNLCHIKVVTLMMSGDATTLPSNDHNEATLLHYDVQ